MKILLVEDQRVGDVYRQTMLDIEHVQHVEWVKNREDALEKLKSNFFDLMVLDLKIPASGLDAELLVENGQEVFYSSDSFALGMPIFFLTGSKNDEFTQELIGQGHVADLWGTGESYNSLRYYTKENPEPLMQEVETIAAEIHHLNAITLNTRGLDLNLSEGEIRVLRVAARRRNAESLTLKRLGGGYSGAKVLAAAFQNAGGQTILDSVAKLASVDEIAAEDRAYSNVVTSLPVGASPQKTDIVDKAAAGCGGVFYRLADTYDRTLFQTISDDPVEGLEAIRELRALLNTWSNSRTRTNEPLSQFRGYMLRDDACEDLSGKYGLDYSSLECRDIRFDRSYIHGDLHGGNVLVQDSQNVVLIDYADAKIGPSCMDPINLELSFIFHPEAIELGLADQFWTASTDWTTRRGAASNGSLDNIVSYCREWAYDVSGDDCAVLAAAYSYVFRQLKYNSVDNVKTKRFLAKIAAMMAE